MGLLDMCGGPMHLSKQGHCIHHQVEVVVELEELPGLGRELFLWARWGKCQGLQVCKDVPVAESPGQALGMAEDPVGQEGLLHQAVCDTV